MCASTVSNAFIELHSTCTHFTEYKHDVYGTQDCISLWPELFSDIML